jgi:hypothetical protein
MPWFYVMGFMVDCLSANPSYGLWSKGFVVSLNEMAIFVRRQLRSSALFNLNWANKPFEKTVHALLHGQLPNSVQDRELSLVLAASLIAKQANAAQHQPNRARQRYSRRYTCICRCSCRYSIQMSAISRTSVKCST